MQRFEAGLKLVRPQSPDHFPFGDSLSFLDRELNQQSGHLEGKLDKASWDKLFTDIKPDDLASKGKPFPIAPYFNDILESYEKKVAN